MSVAKRLLGTSIFAVAMIVSQDVVAADGGAKDNSMVASLAAGRPAGVKRAQETNYTFPIVVGGVVLAAGIALVVVGNHTPPIATSTGTTS